MKRPPGLGGPLTFWRLIERDFAPVWDNGQGASIFGVRWNSIGHRTVYCCLDPATAILEVAVHTGFRALDIEPRLLMSGIIVEPERVHVVDPGDLPNANWLHPCAPSAGQQQFGDALLAKHRFVAFPSVVSTHSWNLIFTAGAGGYDLHLQEAFALDTRLHPALAA